MCTILNMIIMLNLLIAIISEAFARINQEKDQASFQEKCDIIADNTYLVPKWRRQTFCPSDLYLLIASDLQQELENQPKDATFLLTETSRKITQSTELVQKRITGEIDKLSKSSVQGIEDRFNKIATDNKNVMDRFTKKFK